MHDLLWVAITALFAMGMIYFSIRRTYQHIEPATERPEEPSIDTCTGHVWWYEGTYDSMAGRQCHRCFKVQVPVGLPDEPMYWRTIDWPYATPLWRWNYPPLLNSALRSAHARTLNENFV